MKTRFTGTGVALVTPFHKYNAIDFGAIEKLVNHLINNYVDYLVVMGTTGESVTLSQDEKNAVIEFIIELNAGRVPIVEGIGGNNTQDIVDKIKKSSFDGIDAILSVCPYYNRPQQKGIYYHFKTIASVSPVPVILYNVPGRTGCNMLADTTLELARDFNNIVAIKEASGNFTQIMKIIQDKPMDFTVISGDDSLTLPLIALGAEGVISVVANAFPADFSEMVNLCLKGNFEAARKIHYNLNNIINSLFEDGSPSGIKAALQVLDLAQNNLRLPLVKVNKSVYLQINTLINNYLEIKK